MGGFSTIPKVVYGTSTGVHLVPSLQHLGNCSFTELWQAAMLNFNLTGKGLAHCIAVAGCRSLVFDAGTEVGPGGNRDEWIDLLRNYLSQFICQEKSQWFPMIASTPEEIHQSMNPAPNLPTICQANLHTIDSQIRETGLQLVCWGGE